jgi:hypothetical protein
MVKRFPRPQSTVNRLPGPWLSWLLLLLAYATYGRLLKHNEASSLEWALSVGFAVVIGGGLTVLWPLCRRVLLLGFQSDFGYFIMALSIASLAVVAVTQFQLFVYVSMLVAVSLLARVDTLVANINQLAAFGILTALALFGLSLSWFIA